MPRGFGLISTFSAFVQALGGIGMFLLGMIILTDALRAAAGDAMRAALTRFTHSPTSGAVTGMVATAILQSSSATTVAAVGFVGAGLLTFPQALGIIFGANIGTTLKGWLIALLGFTYDLADFVYPILAVGVAMRLFAAGRAASIGLAIAGFSVIFIGIDLMQDSMAGLESIISPERFPPPTVVGTLILAAMGFLVTVITQSSSVGVAAAITAVHAGAITFHQAASLVVGMDVGTTLTAAVAAIGGSVGAKRTGLSHVIYNLLTGAGALLLIVPFIVLCEMFAPRLVSEDAEVGLVAFHTLFNTLGVIAILPFARPFARLIERLVPEKPATYRVDLDVAYLEDARLALNAARTTTETVFMALLRHINALLGDPAEGLRGDLKELDRVLDETQSYLDRIRLSLHEGPEWDQYIALAHGLDHLQRLHARCEEQEDRAATALTVSELAGERELLIEANRGVIESLRAKRWVHADKQTAAVREQIHAKVDPLRDVIISKIARDDVSVTDGTRALDAIRWLRRVSQHVDKITHYLAKAVLAAGS